MIIRELIDYLESTGLWVDFNNTRDIVFTGNVDDEIKRVAICWVATNKVINKAIENDVNLIITHENPFYNFSTSPNKHVLDSARKKLKLIQSHNITVYRCHDVWDKIPEVGVADTWAKQLGLDCLRDVSSYTQHCTIEPIKVNELAVRVANSLIQSGENGVYVFGNSEKFVSRLGIGTGAATDIFQMLSKGCDACIVSDDGINNYFHVQFALDNDLPLIVVNHACSEILGVRKMVDFLKDKYTSLDVEYYDEGYEVNYFIS